RLDTRLQVDATRGGWLARLGAPKYLRVDKAHAAGSALGTLGRPVITTHLTAQGVSLADRKLDTVDAPVKIAMAQLSVTAIKGDGLGGHIEKGSAVFDLYASDGDITRPLKEPQMDVKVDGKDLSFGQVLGRDDITGLAQIHLEAKGPARDPTGEVSIK